MVYKREPRTDLRGQTYEMFRPVLLVVLATIVLSQYVVFAFDVSTSKNEQVLFTEADVVPKTQLKTLAAEPRGNGFIGDLIIGQRYADETIFRRVVEYNNPSNIVQRSTLTLNVNNGVIHYISAINDVGSYAVICDGPNSLGSPRSAINIRVSPNTRSTFTLVIAAH